MDSRAVQNQAHGYGEHHHNSHNVGSQQVAHGEEHDRDHEKKSVLKKVKQKAKKIKDTITKHGHHDQVHGHEYHYEDQHIPDDHDLDEEDEVDEYPEVHGAPIYDSATVRSAAPGQVDTVGRPGDNFGGTTIIGEEPNEPRFVLEEIEVHAKLNLGRPMHLDEDPNVPRSAAQACAPANYQTKVTDPSGTGGEEIDFTPVEKSFSRMTVHNEPKAYPETKFSPTVAQTQYPSAGRQSQFEPELSTAANYPSAGSYGQYKPELSGEVKTQYPKSHDQFTPQLSTPTKTHYPSTKTNDQHFPQHSSATKTQYPSSGSHDLYTPLLSTEPNIQHPQHPSTQIHNQHLPLPQQSSATNTQYLSSQSNDQMPVLTEPKVQYPYTKIHDQHLPHQSTVTQTQHPSSGNHDHLAPELSFSPEPNSQYPSTKIHDQHLPQQSSQYPSAGSHDQFLPEFSTQSKTPQTYTSTQVMEPRYEPMEKPSNQSSYTDKISAATSTIADTAISAKNAVTSKLGYGDNRTGTETTQTRDQKQKTSNENPSTVSLATAAIADKAVAAKNTVASTLGYGPNTEATQTRNREENTGNEKPSTISSAASAIADKAATAKNTVASKLGYGTNTEGTQTKYQAENTSNEKPSTISSATSAITETAATAKNAVASKLGYGDKNDTETIPTMHQEEHTSNKNPSAISSATTAIADKAASAKNTVASKLGFGGTATTNEQKRSEQAAAPTEYGKGVTQSLTEKLAPVHGKVAGVGTGQRSKASGTDPVGVEQDKGVSVRDYVVDKLRPGEEDRALSEVISETLHKKEKPHAVHKREDEPQRRVEHQRVLGKVTESEEVKRRLGGEDEKTEKRYQEMYINSPGTGVVDKVKGMVGSWFTNPGENQSSQDSSPNYGAGVEQVNQGAGERRLQESSN
ncbi:hypothetical protein VNO78_32806 [Psophocarpus tetragonolobus]|uniref:Low-temperature-induced 65 kDa protein n=1 Tax=Psophocarpus tetragonolobus TaxID=3891 RepID=A0AAN9RS51_PSOTE